MADNPEMHSTPVKCPFATMPIACEPPFFADEYEVCHAGNTLTLCLSFKGKLLVTVVIDKILAKGLAKTMLDTKS